jgi:hypothetical protein
MYPREPRRWESGFGRWVSDFGIARLAPQLGVTRTCIYHWVQGRREPRPEQARAIVELSGGAVPLEAIYRRPRGAREPGQDQVACR